MACFGGDHHPLRIPWILNKMIDNVSKQIGADMFQRRRPPASFNIQAPFLVPTSTCTVPFDGIPVFYALSTLGSSKFLDRTHWNALGISQRFGPILSLPAISSCYVHLRLTNWRKKVYGRTWIVLLSSCLCLSAIIAVFWHQDWQYSMPAIRPADLQQPDMGAARFGIGRRARGNRKPCISSIRIARAPVSTLNT